MSKRMKIVLAAAAVAAVAVLGILNALQVEGADEVEVEAVEAEAVEAEASSEAPVKSEEVEEASPTE